MDLQKLNWKFFIENPAADLAQQTFRVFNTWIPDSPEIFIDVVDYSHVAEGPLTLLCGYKSDVALDAAGGAMGIQYNHKHRLTGDNPERLRLTFKAAARAALRVMQDKSIPGGVRFLGTKILLIANDRASAPNTLATFTAVQPWLKQALDDILGAGTYALKHLAHPRERFGVEITLARPGRLADWAK